MAAQSAERARVIEAIAPQGPVSESKPAKEDPTLQCYQKKTADVNLFYGKNVDGDISNLADVEAIDGEIIVRGPNGKNTKNKRIMLASLTDFTDSITVKRFLRLYQVEALRPMLQPGCFVKVKGLIAFDLFDKEKAITNVIGIAKTDNFSILRMDAAKEVKT